MTVLNVLTPERRSRSDVRAGSHDRITVYLRTLLFADALAALVGALLAYALHPAGSDSDDLQIFSLRLAVALMPIGWPLALWLQRAYDRRRAGLDAAIGRKVVSAAGVMAACLAFSALLVDSTSLFRQLIMAIALAAALTPIARGAARVGLSRANLGLEQRRVLLVGHARSVADFAAQVRPNRAPWLRIVGACLVGPTEPEEAESLELAVHGDLGSVVDTAASMNCDVVIVLTSPELDGSTLRELSWRLHEHDVDLAVVPMLVGVAAERISVDSVDGLPIRRRAAPFARRGPLKTDARSAPESRAQMRPKRERNP